MIDCFATDHAPHLKQKTNLWLSRFTGLETALPLLLTQLIKGKLTIDDIANKCYYNPKRILRLNEDYGKDSYIEINLDKEYIISDDDLVTKVKWSPFNGVKVKGCLERFVFKNKCVYNNGLIDNLDKGINVNIYKNNLSFNKNNLDESSDINVDHELEMNLNLMILMMFTN